MNELEVAVTMASKPNNSRDVFVGNLPDDADEESLSQVFSVIGDVQSVIIKDGKNNMSKFCFVRFYNEDHVETAINEMNGKFFKGKNLSVKPAGRKGNKPDGGGVNRQMDQRNFQGQQRRQQGYANRPWGDAGFDKEDFKQWKEESVAVTHIVDATTFYAQICNPDTATAYQNMITQLFHHCSFNPPPATEVNVNQIYGAIFSVDSGWYRCQVKRTDPTTGKLSVQFVDYGNEETVDSVVELPPVLAQIPFFAVKMSLYGMEPCFPNKASENAQKAFEYLSSLSEAENVTVRIANSQPNPQEYSVVVFQDGQNVNEFIQNNFADKHPSPAMSPVQQDGGANFPGGRPNQHQRNWSSPPPQGSHDATAALVGQLQNEKANLIQKVHELKMDMQVLKQSRDIEVKSYKEKVDFAMDFKLALLLGSLRRVRETRNLYPCGDDQKSPLERAIDTIHGGEVTINSERKTFREATPEVATVDEKLTHLNSCQDAIRNCDKKEDLANLIEDRNVARRQAFQVMKDFMDVCNQLPIEERLNDLKKMINSITSGYQSLVQPAGPSEGSPEEVYDQYKAWLDLKTKKLKSYWKETDESLETWRGLLAEMEQAFSFSSDSEFEAQNLDSTVQQLLVAMETELVISRQGYEPKVPLNPEILKQRHAELQLESEVLTKTVQAVLHDAREEATFLEQLSSHCKNYQEKIDVLEEWLDNKPNMEELQTLQKKIKVTRSKLRHLLVDLRDGEEDPDLLGDKTVEELRNDIAGFQEQLLGHYTTEDEHLLRLAHLTREHFPELAMLHAHLGLQKYIDSDGLIKEGRDLMHFNLTPFPSCSKTTTKLASIGDKGVAVIKSHHLPDVQSQIAFLESVKLYKSIPSPHLLPVYGIIPDKDSNQYHLQSWYHPMGSFHDVMMSDTPLSQSEILAHLKNTLIALQTLHSIQFFYGSLHPNNVLFKSREEILLADYDFSKTHMDRANLTYVSSNGLHFRAPEISQGRPPSTASDIFSFGVLVLWAHYPTSPFQIKSNGTPELDGLPIPRDLVNFVAPMLHCNPANRPNVKHILDFGYLDRLVGTEEEVEDTNEEESREESHKEEETGPQLGDEETKEEDAMQEGDEEEANTVEEEQTEDTIETEEAVNGVTEKNKTDEKETEDVEEKDDEAVVSKDEDTTEEVGGVKEEKCEGSSVDDVVKSPPTLTNGSQPSDGTTEEILVSPAPPPLLDD